jgi:prepilin-type processing-associated H-X9-DG protein
MYRIIGADGREYGPVTAEQISQWLAQGRANAQSKVKSEGAADWQTLGSLAEFAADLPRPASAPAPLIATPATAPKTSGMAIASLVLGILGPLSCGLTALVGLILGIISMNKIKESGGQLGGHGLALAGTIVSGVFLLIVPISVGSAMLLPALSKAKAKAQSISCINNVKQLNLGVMLYAQVNGDRCPAAEAWCDAVLTNVGSAKVFQCVSADSNRRCHYAFNGKLGGLKMADISNPGRTVMIFETEGGWNLSGGREQALKRPRHAQGLVVGFADGHVELVTNSRLAQLVWDL